QQLHRTASMCMAIGSHHLPAVDFINHGEVASHLHKQTWGILLGDEAAVASCIIQSWKAEWISLFHAIHSRRECLQMLSSSSRSIFELHSR
ncbi:hypothetical protein Dimus_032096, partial [Dionaea muscipula]